MANSRTQDSGVKMRTTAPPALDLTATQGNTSTTLSPEDQSINTPTRRKWPGTPTKVMKPMSAKVLARMAAAELTAEEAERKRLNDNMADNNAEIDPMNFEYDMNALERAKAELGTVKVPKTPSSATFSKKPMADEPMEEVPAYVMFKETIENEQGLTSAFPEGQVESEEAKVSRTSQNLEEPKDSETLKAPKPSQQPEGSARLNSYNYDTPIFPSVTIGAKETIPLSKIGRADREVRMWEEIIRSYEQNHPSLVPLAQEQLHKAREDRAHLDESLEENTRVGDADPAASAIAKRVSALEWGLSTSKFGPEAENIKCAMEGYKSGAITFCDHYTIIYAGRIVDTAPDYRSFVHNREERLDKYFASHGPGWMWYEPPLKIHPETRIRASTGVGLFRDPAWHALAPYFVNQGFWKRSGFVKRIPSIGHMELSPQDHLFPRNQAGEVWCQDRALPLCFRTLLDSGATFPSLHPKDFCMLGINPLIYGAQSLDIITTAGGQVTCRVFELFSAILNADNQHLVKENDAVWPFSFKFLGGLTPVIELNHDIGYDAEGNEVTNRLSGLLPFLACYVGSAPTKSVLWLGEDRNDVLGHHRMPGQRKWAVDMAPIGQFQPGPDKFGNPKIAFSHRGGVIMDIDHPSIRHRSDITFLLAEGGKFVEISHPLDMQLKEHADFTTAPLIPGDNPEGPFAGGGSGEAENAFSPDMT